MNAEPMHKPVLLKAVIDALRIREGGRYIDCTLGGGGHSHAILEACDRKCMLLGIDADPAATETARERLKPFVGNVILVNDNFRNLAEICANAGFAPADGILFDLGWSSLQLAETGRGFSFQEDAPLDMRFNPGQELTAADIINTYSESEIARILWEYGEERHSRPIARRIVESRPVNTTLELAGLVERAFGGKRGKIHPATRTFQALRIAVNEELEVLKSALEQAVGLLASGGRIAVISFHSLEDRIVKDYFRRESTDCLCPPAVPQCVCGHKAALKLVTKKPITASSAEMAANPRSRSAKLRVAERV